MSYRVFQNILKLLILKSNKRIYGVYGSLEYGGEHGCGHCVSGGGSGQGGQSEFLAEVTAEGCKEYGLVVQHFLRVRCGKAVKSSGELDSWLPGLGSGVEEEMLTNHE